MRVLFAMKPEEKPLNNLATHPRWLRFFIDRLVTHVFFGDRRRFDCGDFYDLPTRIEPASPHVVHDVEQRLGQRQTNYLNLSSPLTVALALVHRYLATLYRDFTMLQTRPVDRELT